MNECANEDEMEHLFTLKPPEPSILVTLHIVIMYLVGLRVKNDSQTVSNTERLTNVGHAS